MMPAVNVQVMDWLVSLLRRSVGVAVSDKAVILHLQLVSDLLLASEAR